MIYIVIAIVLIVLAIISYKKFIFHYRIYMLSKDVWKNLNEEHGLNEPFREIGDIDEDEGEDE